MGDRARDSKGAGWRALLPCRRSTGRSLELPLEHVGLISYLSYAWLDGFMWRAFRRGLTETSLWKCPSVDGAQHNADRLSQLWDEEIKKVGRDKASLSAVFMRFIRKRLLLSILVLVVSLAFLLLSVAYFLLEVMNYSYQRKDDLWLGLIYVFGFLIVDILQNVLFLCVFSITHIAGARLRSAALMVLYRKLLTISYLRDKTTGYIVNLFANDSQRIFDGVSYAPMLLVAPILGVATTAYSLYLLGPWPLIGFAVLLFLFPVQMCVGKLIMTFRARAMPITDQRVRSMLEMLASIKFIKMYSWEKSLTDNVLHIRNGEKSLIEKVNMSTSMIFSVSTIVVSMATVATLMAHTLSGHDLTAVEAFIYLAVYSSIQGKLMLSTMAVKSFSELKVAADRFQEILLYADHTRSVGIEDDHEVSDFAIEVTKASIQWPGSEPSETKHENENKENGDSNHNGRIFKRPENGTEMEQINLKDDEDSTAIRMLNNLSFRVRRGEVVGVTGPIGSGKSALITGLIGQMHVHEGHVYVRGKVAYVPQQAWIFNSTLKENILFGKQYEKTRYDKVVQLCCLEMDFSVLPSGDATEVGERGVTLSGGQKQRISLARALYSNRDVYLLDDPFSAVDPDIADTLYQNLIQNSLVGKTVVFVTHTAKYLPNCDLVLFMREGSIVQQGSHDELRESGGEYYDYYLATKNHDGQTKELKSQTTDDLEVDGCVIGEKKNLLTRQSTKDKSSAIKEESEKLIHKEEQEAGAVTATTYKVYTQAAGGIVAVIVLAILFVLAEGSRVFSYWWLAHWLSQGSGSNNMTVASLVVVPYGGNGSYQLDNIPVTTTAPGVGGGSIADNPKLPFYNLVYGLSLLLTLILFIFRAIIFTKFSMRGANVLHRRLLQKIMRSSMEFFDTTPLGRVMNRFSRDMDEVDSHLPPMVEQTLQSIISILLYVIMISVILHWFPIALPILLFVFLFLYAIFRVGLRDLKRLQNVSVSPLLSHISATVQGGNSLHAYDKVQDFSHRFVELLDYNSVTLILFNFCMRWINLRLSFITSIVGFLTALLVVLLPDVIAPAYAGLAIVYATQLAGLFQFFTRSAAEAEARFTSVERIDNYIQNLEPEADLIVPNYRPPGEWPKEGHIRFDQVQMRYRQGLPLVLKSVSFEIKPGEKIGIVGRTGSGKSSLATSLFRLVEISGGKIEIDGMDIARMGIEDLRTKLSAIPQDPVLFAGTIRSNLDPSLRSIDEEIWRALEKCHIKDLVLTLEGQLDAVVSEGGDNFSAGEKQLLCMARVLLRHSRVLVLDEATAAMDSETDSLIQKALKESFADCTLLIIAHRLSTVLTSDRVLVMNKGEVVEFDTPDALMAKPDSCFNELMAIASDKDTPEDANDMLASDAWV